MYFPFLDQDTKSIMQKTMDEAHSYYDFVQRLNQRVLAEECPDLLIYFAIHHSALLLDMESINAIGKKYGKLQILRPNLYYASVHQGNAEDVAKVHASADAILESDPPDWLAIEMRFLKFEVDLLQYPKTIYDTSNLDALEKLIKRSPEFEFFENILYDCYREKASRDGDNEEIIRCTELAIERAEKFDDIVRLAYHLRVKSVYLRGTDVVQAKQALLKARDIMKSLGNIAGLTSTLIFLSRLDATRGQYNLAIERNLEAIRIREKMHLPTEPYALMLSTSYNAIGSPSFGMEWGRFAEADAESNPIVKNLAILNQAWSLILMGKLTQALTLIDSIREPILKSGMETVLAWFYFVTGVFEMAQGDLEAAAKNIEDAIELYEGKSQVQKSIICLHYLAQLDILRADLTSGEPFEEGVIPWLTLLEEKATSDDLPGILGQVYLLKARIAVAQSDEGTLRVLIEKIRTLGKDSSMAFLNDALVLLLKHV
jgi:tetratricopeptide (TPR) repeat protein